MKKILITLMTLLALTTFTACESKDVETAEETTTASVSEETTAETTTEATTEAKTEAETTTEKETESETEAVNGTELFKGTGYTFEIDGEKWLDATEYLELIAKFAENTDAAQHVNLTAEDLENMGDAVFYHASNGSNFNVTIVEVGDVSVIDDEMLEQLAALMQEQYNAITGYNCEEYKIVEVNGYKAIKFVIATDAALVGADLKLNAYLFYQGTKQIAVTYSSPASNFDDIAVDFEEVLNTISFE